MKPHLRLTEIGWQCGMPIGNVIYYGAGNTPKEAYESALDILGIREIEANGCTVGQSERRKG